MISLRETIQELFYERTRIILTILAIAWGTFTIAVMLAVGEGLRLNFVRTMANVGDNLLEITSGVTSKNYRGIHANRKINFTKRDVAAIAKLQNVDSVMPQYNFHAKLHYKDHNIHARFQAVMPQHALVHKIQVGPKQRFISPIDFKERNYVVVIGSDTAKRIFSSKEDPIGKVVYIVDRPFVVVGVMQEKSQMYSEHGPDAWFNWIPASTYELLSNTQQIDAIELSYKDFKLLPQTQNTIQKILALNHGADPNDEGIVNFSSPAKAQKKVNKFFVGMQIFLGIVGSLTLLIAGVGIANVMYASVKRATQQIGVQMALGATRRHILSRYILESLVVTFIGGAIGVLLALLFVWLVSFIPIRGEFIKDIGRPEPVLSFLVLTIVVMVLGIMGFIAGLFPALKAAKIDPAEALIYE